MLQQIRIDDLLARDVDVRWIEGVALVQAVCRQVLPSSTALGGFPSPAGIVLAAAGTIEVSGPVASGHPVAAAAHLLARMLNDDVPVRLRLAVTQATGGVEAYPTLQDFSSALAYFERPDGDRILSALFERSSLAAIRSRDLEHPEQSPSPEQNRAVAEEVPPRRRRGLLWLLAPLAALVYAGVLWAFAPGLSTARAMTGFSPATRSSSAPASVGSSSKKGPPRRYESTREARRGTLARSETPLPHLLEPLPVPQLHPSVEGEISWVPGGITVGAVNQSASDRSGQPPLVFFSSLEITASPASATPGNYQQQGNLPDTGRIYSRADPGVIPPRSVYPKLPDPPPPGTKTANEAVLDLLIAPTGIVEHVALRTTPKHIHEFMLVSAAKAWQFQPATLDGHPVRFLHRVLLPLN